MKREFLITGDGSVTIRLPEWNEQYHSHHGAITEADHVFIKHGLLSRLKRSPQSPLKILEVGFGTGLNALMTLLEAQRQNVSIHYHGIEAFPIDEQEYGKLNYAEKLGTTNELFLSLHQAAWGADQTVDPCMSLFKEKVRLEDLRSDNHYDLIYFDAFGPRVQPEMWTPEVFSRLFEMTQIGGILVTYSAKGSVRRGMQAAGYTVERLEGPPGKREMLRATRSDSSRV